MSYTFLGNLLVFLKFEGCDVLTFLNTVMPGYNIFRHYSIILAY